jgi:hypothetical protein
MAHFGGRGTDGAKYGCMVIRVNTPRWWRHKNGDDGTKQIDHRAAKAGVRNKPLMKQFARLVVVHQPVACDALKMNMTAWWWEPAVRAWSAAVAPTWCWEAIFTCLMCASCRAPPHTYCEEDVVWQAGTA